MCTGNLWKERNSETGSLKGQKQFRWKEFSQMLIWLSLRIWLAIELSPDVDWHPVIDMYFTYTQWKEKNKGGKVKKSSPWIKSHESYTLICCHLILISAYTIFPHKLVVAHSLCYPLIVLSFTLLPILRMYKQNVTSLIIPESQDPLSLLDAPPAVSWQCLEVELCGTENVWEGSARLCTRWLAFLSSHHAVQYPLPNSLFLLCLVYTLCGQKSLPGDRYQPLIPLFEFNSGRYISQDNYSWTHHQWYVERLGMQVRNLNDKQ